MRQKIPRPLSESLIIYQKELKYKDSYQHNTTSVISLGLGTLSFLKSRYQLAFLQIIALPTLIHDPLFTADDLHQFNSLHMTTGEMNLKVHTKTLFYMIHCPHSLYEQVLTENKDGLENVVILGNDFEQYTERSNLPFLANLLATDRVIFAKFELEDFHSTVFTGTKWHTFRGLYDM